MLRNFIIASAIAFASPVVAQSDADKIEYYITQSMFACLRNNINADPAALYGGCIQAVEREVAVIKPDVGYRLGMRVLQALHNWTKTSDIKMELPDGKALSAICEKDAVPFRCATITANKVLRVVVTETRGNLDALVVLRDSLKF